MGRGLFSPCCIFQWINQSLSLLLAMKWCIYCHLIRVVIKDMLKLQNLCHLLIALLTVFCKVPVTVETWVTIAKTLLTKPLLILSAFPSLFYILVIPLNLMQHYFSKFGCNKIFIHFEALVWRKRTKDNNIWRTNATDEPQPTLMN